MQIRIRWTTTQSELMQWHCACRAAGRFVQGRLVLKDGGWLAISADQVCHGGRLQRPMAIGLSTVLAHTLRLVPNNHYLQKYPGCGMTRAFSCKSACTAVHGPCTTAKENAHPFESPVALSC